MAISQHEKQLILKRACVSKKWLKGFTFYERKAAIEENFSARKEALVIKIKMAQQEIADMYKSMAAEGHYYEYQQTKEFKDLRGLIFHYFGNRLNGADVINTDVNAINLVIIP